MFQGYNGEQVLYKPPSTNQMYPSNYYGQVQMTGQARSSIPSGQPKFNPYNLPLYQSEVTRAYQNTITIPEVDKDYFKFLDAVSPYHFMNTVASDPFQNLQDNAVKVKDTFKGPDFVRY